MATKAVVKSAVSTLKTFQKDLFRDKVVFVTGGRSGICYKITEAMMRHGADSVIVGRNAEGLAQSAQNLSGATGRQCLPASADVRKPDQVKEAVEAAIKKYGKIDFVICGAAGNFLAPISGLSENAFKTVIDIDLLGTYNTIKATLPHVRKTQGSYVHISATLHYFGLPYQAHVSAAKAGVDALSQVLAIEEGPRGVRSNVIAPGPIAGTEGMDRLSTKGDRSLASIPLGRMGDKEEIAGMALFLFSESANWVTGQVFVVDGGESHVRKSQLPYPQAVLDPESVRDIIKPKL
jgi:peroxisomal 2,4-dienoyl-CoA reductase